MGALTAALAVAGHGIGGGGQPTSTALTLLVLGCGGVGALAGGEFTDSRRGNRVALLGALTAGQWLGHLTLTAALPHPHPGPTLWGPSMLAAHAAATAACAALILAAESLYGPVTRTLRVILGDPVPTASTPSGIPVPTGAAIGPHRFLDHVVSRRGPPATPA